jgi:hypothetical protein
MTWELIVGIWFGIIFGLILYAVKRGSYHDGNTG